MLNTKKLHIAMLRQFRALPIQHKRDWEDISSEIRIQEELYRKTIAKGFMFHPNILCEYSPLQTSGRVYEPDYLISLVEKEIGLSPEEMNSSFHKSWKKVATASMEQLVIEQILHYLTTYGYEALNPYLLFKWGSQSPFVYIPKEELNIPELTIEEGMKIFLIKGYTKEETEEKIRNILSSGIALKRETMRDIVTIMDLMGIKIDIKDVKNKEVSCVLHNMMGTIPENPVEFLRFLVFNLTGDTLLIKSKDLIGKIRLSEKVLLLEWFNQYELTYGLERLAEIFYRFKPIFLAFKNSDTRKPASNLPLRWNSQGTNYPKLVVPEMGRTGSKINKIRKLAVKYHKPMREDILNNITSAISDIHPQNINYIADPIERELERVNIFRKIRLAYALKYRTEYHDSIMYRIRNGKAYATDFNFSNYDTAKEALNIVKKSIINDVEKNVGGKSFYIPEYMNYTLPATEKQFTGNIPSGSYIKNYTNDIIFGIHWNNVKDRYGRSQRIDLDLSVIDENGHKVGWDSSYRSKERDILFSGDVTDAGGKNGASELFFIDNSSRIIERELIMLVNFYNYSKEISVPFTILVSIRNDNGQSISSNYMVDPNSILATAKTKIDKHQMICGVVSLKKDGLKFHFAETSIGGMRRSSKQATYMKHARRYLLDFYKNPISLNDILLDAGATIYPWKNEADKDIIDLSPENLEKDTILRLLK